MTPELYDAFADALEAAAASLRQKARQAEIAPGGEPGQRLPLDAVTRARRIHPMLGPRQAQVIEVLEQHGSTGTNTGVISKAIAYDQPNVYLTLQGLMTLGFVTKDETASPHVYRLTPLLLDAGSEQDAA